MSLLNEGYTTLAINFLHAHQHAEGLQVRSCALRLQRAHTDVRELIGKRVLDLGCGSVYSKDTMGVWKWIQKGFPSGQVFPPWYLRMAAFAGAHGTGIDIAPNDNEPFTAITADLTDRSVLTGLPSGAFDIVSNNMFTAPSGGKEDRGVTSPFLFETLGSLAEVHAFNTFLREQVCRLLVDGGVYTHMYLTFRKEHGELRRTGMVEQM